MSRSFSFSVPRGQGSESGDDCAARASQGFGKRRRTARTANVSRSRDDEKVTKKTLCLLPEWLFQRAIKNRGGEKVKEGCGLLFMEEEGVSSFQHSFLRG